MPDEYAPNPVTRADELPYDNTSSGLTAEQVQAAIDEILTRLEAGQYAGTGESILVADQDGTSFITNEAGTEYLVAD